MSTTDEWVISTLGSHVLAWAERTGFDTQALLETAGLARSLFDPPPKKIPALAMVDLWRALAEVSDDPAFALRSGSAAAPGVLRALGHAMVAASSLRSAIELLIKHASTLSNVVDARAYVEGDALVLRQDWLNDAPRLAPQIAESVASHWTTFPEVLCGHFVRPIRVGFPFDRPMHASAHDEFFGCPIDYRKPGLELSWRLEDTEQAFVTHDPLVLERLSATLGSMPRGGEMTSKTRALLRTSNGPASATPAQTAKLLGLSMRTLQRRLAEEGTTFRTVAEAVIMTRAKAMLEEGALTLDAIALELGYGDRSSFHRAFVRVHGIAPSRWRADR